MDQVLRCGRTVLTVNYVLSPWYASYADRWARVEYLTIPTRRESLTGARTLTLRPAQ